MKTLKDFIMNVSFEQVAEVLKRKYPKDWKGAGNGEGFEMVFNNLKEMEPVSRDDGMKIEIKHIVQNFEGEIEEFDSVGGVDDDGKRWALDFIPWAEWLGMGIHENTLQNYSHEEIVAHALWEMTFYGYYEEDIQQKADDLRKAKEEIENGTAKLVKFDPSIFLH